MNVPDREQVPDTGSRDVASLASEGRIRQEFRNPPATAAALEQCREPVPDAMPPRPPTARVLGHHHPGSAAPVLSAGPTRKRFLSLSSEEVLMGIVIAAGVFGLTLLVSYVTRPNRQLEPDHRPARPLPFVPRCSICGCPSH
jgi:hypothetical protein